MDLFDILKDISAQKKDLSEHEEFKKKYNKFMINRYLSMHRDTVFMANVLNRYPDIPEKAQYKFYLKAIDKKSRYFKYAKKEDNKKETYLKAVMEYYNLNEQKALDIIPLLSEDQLKKIEKRGVQHEGPSGNGSSRTGTKKNK